MASERSELAFYDGLWYLLLIAGVGDVFVRHFTCMCSGGLCLPEYRAIIFAGFSRGGEICRVKYGVVKPLVCYKLDIMVQKQWRQTNGKAWYCKILGLC